jgi:hypothetical protein
MTDSSQPVVLASNELNRAYQAVQVLIAYAYEQGFHEMGYEPEKLLWDEIERLTGQRDQLHRQLLEHAEVCGESAYPLSMRSGSSLEG